MEERRDSVRRLLGAVAWSLVGGSLLAGGAHACELPPGVRVESERLAVSFRTTPEKIAVGEPFTLDLAACPKGGALDLGRVRLDAHMPEHRHGMNYRTRVVRLGGGRFHSEGWLFHMPGRWEFVFELGPERLTHSVRIE
ncbi:MAG TPA: hypothetical protein VMT02_04445 [Burkholderiales bacterium]|jgi:hypothetical protein|nr:hypothetical protein [Burkholderiales bacterium]